MSKTYWTWEKSGNYNIRAKTRIEKNGEYIYSDWSEPLHVSVKFKLIRTYPILIQLFEILSSKLPFLNRIYST